MINNIVKASAFYETHIEEIKMVKRLSQVSRLINIEGRTYLCAPSIPTLSKKLAIEASAIQREIENLIGLKWVRKFVDGKKYLYAIGTPSQTFMEHRIEKLYVRAKRTKTGAFPQTEWKWIPLDRWTGLTLWTYLSERFRVEKTIWPRFADARGRAQMQRIVGRVGIHQAKTVADFLVENWEKLKAHYRWTGVPSCGLFEGFFFSLMDLKDKGIPAYQHDRQHDGASSKDDDGWKEFDGA